MKLPTFFPNLKAKREAARRAAMRQALVSTRDACRAAYNDAKARKDSRDKHTCAIALERAQRACLEAGA